MMFFGIIRDSYDKNKNKNKLERLYHRYNRILYKEAYDLLNNKHLAEDAVSETFEKVMKNLHKIDESNTDRTCNFLITICKNTARDILKLQSKESSYEHLSDFILPDNEDPLNIVISNQGMDDLISFISGMDFKYKSVIYMKYVYGMDNEEIAKILNINPETVKKRIYRARKKISEKLGEEASK